MASAATLIRSGRCVTQKGNTLTLAAAMPLTGKVTVVFPDELGEATVTRFADELKKAIAIDGGKHYHAVLSIWILVAKKAFGLED